MMNNPFELAYGDTNPLDAVEEFLQDKGWAHTRTDGTLLSAKIPLQKGVLEASMEWQEEFSALPMAFSLPVAISDEAYDVAVHALARINENVWMGHFDLSDRGLHPTFRYTLLLRMIPSGVALDLIADVIDIAVAECNRFHSTFQLAQAGDARLHDDLDAAVMETAGEA